MNGKETSHNGNGFTLIEIALALLIISIGILSVIGVVGASLDTAKKMTDDIQAISFSDMVFGYFHSQTNWARIPGGSAMSVQIPDFNYDTAVLDQTIEINASKSNVFVSKLPPKYGSALVENFIINYKILAAEPDPNRKTMSIHVWPGYTPRGRARIFHTEFYNWADR